MPSTENCPHVRGRESQWKDSSRLRWCLLERGTQGTTLGTSHRGKNLRLSAESHWGRNRDLSAATRCSMESSYPMGRLCKTLLIWRALESPMYSTPQSSMLTSVLVPSASTKSSTTAFMWTIYPMPIYQGIFVERPTLSNGQLKLVGPFVSTATWVSPGQPQLWSPTSWWSRIWLASRLWTSYLKGGRFAPTQDFFSSLLNLNTLSGGSSGGNEWTDVGTEIKAFWSVCALRSNWRHSKCSVQVKFEDLASKSIFLQKHKIYAT